jgi:signal transduction histidine kinase
MPRVLVVEDSPTQAHQLAFLLEEAGFAVAIVPDAEQGYEYLQRERFDAVLSDLLLPGDSGFDLCRRIKEDPAFRTIPVIVLTSQADPVNVLRGLQAGADGFMTKDREPAEIIGRLRRTLDRSRQPVADKGDRTQVQFFDAQYELTADREQLVNILLAAFEDVVYLSQKYQASENALRKLNAQLQETVHSERQAHEALKQAQSRLVQAEKLSALGQMVAGVAHEINNPLAFVSNNITVLKRDVGELCELLRLYQEADTVLAVQQPELVQRISALAEQIDLAYTLDNLQGLLNRSREGLSRIQQIVKNLRDFARLDESELKQADINAGVESTINIIHGQAKNQGVQIQRELAPLPELTCYPAQVNQVVLNLLANAIDACQRGGQVTVRTCPRPDGVEIHILDTGSGIDPAVRERIFDPFFTTKPPGQGTGLGLSISYGIVQKHGGKIGFESVPGRGSHFTVFLPFRSAPR